MRLSLSASLLSFEAYPPFGRLPTLAMVLGSSIEKPASASSASAASRTERAIGPTTSRRDESGMTPAFGTSPNVGLMPTSPWADAGFWIDPPVSSARPSTQKLAPTAVAVPALEPPGRNSRPAELYVE